MCHSLLLKDKKISNYLFLNKDLTWVLTKIFKHPKITASTTSTTTLMFCSSQLNFHKFLNSCKATRLKCRLNFTLASQLAQVLSLKQLLKESSCRLLSLLLREARLKYLCLICCKTSRIWHCRTKIRFFRIIQTIVVVVLTK